MNSVDLQTPIFEACAEDELFSLFTVTSGLLHGFLCQGTDAKFIVSYVVDAERLREQKWEKEREKQLSELEKQFLRDYSGHQTLYEEAKTRFLLQKETELLYTGELAERFGSLYIASVSARVQDRWLEALLNMKEVYDQRDVEKKRLLESKDFDLIYTNVTVGGVGGGRTLFGSFSEQVLFVLQSAAKEIDSKKQESMELDEKERKVLLANAYVNCHGFLQNIMSNLREQFNGQDEAKVYIASDTTIDLEKYKERVLQLIPKPTLPAFFEKLSPRKRAGSPRSETSSSSLFAEDINEARRKAFFFAGGEFVKTFSELIGLMEDRQAKDFHEQVKKCVCEGGVSKEEDAFSENVRNFKNLADYKKIFKAIQPIFSSLFLQKTL
jgi:hypothetical protein